VCRVLFVLYVGEVLRGESYRYNGILADPMSATRQRMNETEIDNGWVFLGRQMLNALCCRLNAISNTKELNYRSMCWSLWWTFFDGFFFPLYEPPIMYATMFKAIRQKARYIKFMQLCLPGRCFSDIGRCRVGCWCRRALKSFGKV